MDAVRKIKKISDLVVSITEEEFNELKEMAKEQTEYFNPLKVATQAKYHALGEHNKKMIECLEALKTTILAGEPVSKL